MQSRDKNPGDIMPKKNPIHIPVLSPERIKESLEKSAKELRERQDEEQRRKNSTEVVGKCFAGDCFGEIVRVRREVPVGEVLYGGTMNTVIKEERHCKKCGLMYKFVPGEKP